ncbi:unnamed protein product [Moneuplotes crassus]|uniref:Uncharacterized protein n=1 Tax=Euplotes crassus TaxID=5936 RepID=A0AAD1XB89_EUPCR|nr:unnamed protein product [Moneuplotes crassus]
MGSCNCTKKSPEVELEVHPRPKRLLKNKFSQSKDLGKDLAPEYQLFYYYDPNDKCKKTLEELYTIVRKCQTIVEKYQSIRSDSYPLSLHQISRLIYQITSAFKMNQFWIQCRWEYKEDTNIKNAFNHIRSQVNELEQKLSVINEVTEGQQTKKVTPKEYYKERDGKQEGQLTAAKDLNFCYSTSQCSQEAAGLNLYHTFETLYRLSCNGLSQKIYQNSNENIHSQNASYWHYFPQKPGLSLEADHRNPEDCVYIKKVRKVALPGFESFTVKTDSKFMKSFHKSVAYFSPCNGLDDLTLASLEPTKIGLYLPQIIKTCARVQKSVWLWGFNLNETQFKKFLMGCRHQEQVTFYQCRFSIPRVPDLSKCMKGTLIKKIWLCFCDENYELSKYSETMENLIKGISVCDLKESLREVEILDLTAKDYFNAIFEKYGLGHIVDNHF